MLMDAQPPLVSIIVPVWNGREKLYDCIQSIRRQSFTDWELILVDDGSTDGTGKLADALAMQEGRMQVIHQPNGGVSRARNRGLAAARGHYVRFVDADDVLPADSLALMVAHGEKTGCCLVIGGFRRIEPGRIRTCSMHPSSEPLGKAAYLQHLCARTNSFYYGVLWNKLFRRSLILQGDVSFQPDLHWGEDFSFVMAYMKQVSTIGYLDAPVYDYTVNVRGLTMRQVFDSIRRPLTNISLKIHHFRLLKELYVHHGYYPQAKGRLWLYLFRTTIYR